MENTIRELVHQLYWEVDINCARASLTCLGRLFHVEINPQTMDSAIGLHGAGGYRAQCGLVEGALMFIGIFFSTKGRNDEEIAEICYRFAEGFAGKFGSLCCRDLRPGGFAENDPPHACEKLTGDAIIYSYQFISALL